MNYYHQDWVKKSIKDVTKKTTQNKPLDDERLIYVDIGSIDRKLKIISSPLHLTGVEAPSRARKRIQTNDVLVSLTRPNLNAVAIVPEEYNDQYASTGFDVLKPDSIEPRFLYYLVRTQDFIDTISGQTKGALYPAAKSADVQSYSFFMPPENEQKRIVDKLDNIMEKVEMAQFRLDKIPTLLKRFRMSVLSAAVSGELTEEWREMNNADYWQLVKLGTVIEKIEAGKNLKCHERPPEGNELGIVKISAVTWGTYNEEESKTLPDDNLFLENRRINVGDFLISRANTIELLGMPVIVHKVTRNLMLSDKVLRLVMDDEDKHWVNIFLRSLQGRKQIESRATGNQQSMRNISQKALVDIDLPMPSAGEKEQLVKIVSELLSKADTVEKYYQAVKARTDKLSQSILARAFRGELFEPFSDKPRNEPIEATKVDEQPSSTAVEDVVEPTEQPTKTSGASTKRTLAVDDKSPIFQLLKKNKNGMTAQKLFDDIADNTFSAIDELFVELKRLLESELITKVGEGADCSFKVGKK